MPYESYRLYQTRRPKSHTEVLRADEQAARLASAISSLFRGITRAGRTRPRPYPRPQRAVYPTR
jgi:hypothetical protein